MAFCSAGYQSHHGSDCRMFVGKRSLTVRCQSCYATAAAWGSQHSWPFAGLGLSSLDAIDTIFPSLRSGLASPKTPELHVERSAVFILCFVNLVRRDSGSVCALLVARTRL